MKVSLNESSSMALSIYSPTNLADLLTDEVEQTREEKNSDSKTTATSTTK